MTTERDAHPRLTVLLRRAGEGDRDAANQAYEAVYGELCRNARRLMRSQPAFHTLDAEGLLHEAYLRLARAGAGDWANRGHFLAVMSRAMRQHLVDHAKGRGSLKRGGGRKPAEFDERYMTQMATVEADDIYESNVFRAKVYAAIRRTESESDFLQFQVYRMRIFDGIAGREVAEQLGVSEPTVSRYLQKVRDVLRQRLAEMMATYSFTREEESEAERAGLGGDDGMFDEALSEVFHQQSRLILEDEAAASQSF